MKPKLGFIVLGYCGSESRRLLLSSVRPVQLFFSLSDGGETLS